MLEGHRDIYYSRFRGNRATKRLGTPVLVWQKNLHNYTGDRKRNFINETNSFRQLFDRTMLWFLLTQHSSKKIDQLTKIDSPINRFTPGGKGGGEGE